MSEKTEEWRQLISHFDQLTAIRKRIEEWEQRGDHLGDAALKDVLIALADITEIATRHRSVAYDQSQLMIVVQEDRVLRGSEDEELLEAVEAVNGLLATAISHTLERMKLPVSREVFDANVERARKLSKASWAIDAVVTILKSDD